MATDDLVEFSWPVPEAGFRWVNGRDVSTGVPGRWLMDAAPRGVRRLRRRYALPHHPALFRIFAETPPTEEGILHFANQYGNLGIAERILPPGQGVGVRHLGIGEPFDSWRREIWGMHQTLALWDAMNAGEEGTIQQWAEVSSLGQETRVFYRGTRTESWLRRLSTSEPGSSCSRLAERVQGDDLIHAALLIIEETVNLALDQRVSPRLVYRVERDRLVLQIAPTSLLGALWLQFAKSIDGNKTYRRCGRCGTWFQLSPELNRTNRLFCSNACRSKAYRERQAEARRLHAEGTPLNEVAQCLGTDPETARGWVARWKPE